MALETTYLNHNVEILPGIYGAERHGQLRTMSKIYNRTVGPVTSLKLLRPELLDLSMYSAHCDHVPVTLLLREVLLKDRPHTGKVPGGGKGITRLDALLGTLGEITERLLAILHWTALADQIEYGTFSELTGRGRVALDPDEMPIFAPEQYAADGFPYAPFTPDTFLGWTMGRELLTGRPILVPAQLVLMYYKLHPAESAIGYATTAGLAFHTDRTKAILHGLFEVMERDALNLVWYCRLAPPRVDVDLTQFLADSLDAGPVRMATPYVPQVDVFLINLDLPIPVFATVAIDRSRHERAFLGGTGASSRRERALAQALFELGQSQTAFHLEDPFGRFPIHADATMAQVVQFHDAPLYYGHARNLGRLEWFMASDDVIPWAEIPASDLDEEQAYAAMASWLDTHGHRPIVLDLDSACWDGMSIAKVFVPQLSQACPPLNPTLGHPRFYDVPAQLGRAAGKLSFGDLTPDPIPFA